MFKSIVGATCACLAVVSFSVKAALITHDFEDYTAGSQFSGVSGEFTVQALDGSSMIILSKPGSFTPSLPGLGDNGLWIEPTRDFEFVFDNPIDFFEIYVLDAEEPLEIRSDTGLIATDVTVGSGTGGPIRLFTIGAIGGGDLFSRVIVDDQCACGPGPYDLLTFNEVSPVPIPAAVWLFGSGLITLIGLARRKQQSLGA